MTRPMSPSGQLPPQVCMRNEQIVGGGTQGLKLVIREWLGEGFLKTVTARSVEVEDYVVRLPQVRNGERDTSK